MVVGRISFFCKEMDGDFFKSRGRSGVVAISKGVVSIFWRRHN